MAGLPTEDAADHRLDPRVLPYWRVVNALAVASLAVASLLGVLAAVLGGGVRGWAAWLLAALWLAGSAVLGPLLNRWSRAVYRHTAWRLAPEGLEIRRGVLWRKVINIPRTRVQHTDVAQGPLERSYGLGTLVVYTAGTEHARVSLGGLDHGIALDLRGRLLPGHGDAV